MGNDTIQPPKGTDNDNLDGGCPPGYTMINGECIANITPPPPNINSDDEA